MSHGHEHVTSSGRHQRRLAVVLALTVLVLALEIIGAVVTGSLALVADAVHLAVDASGIALALAAVRVAQRPSTERRTFGLQRAEVLAAGVSGLLLIGLGGYVAAEAIARLVHPRAVESGPMAAVAVVALAVALACVGLLASARDSSITLRAAFLEVLSDALGAAAVLVAAVLIHTWGALRADPVASLVVAALVVPRTIRLLRDAAEVLLEATPRGMSLTEVRDHLLGVAGVVEVHDLHAWTITSGSHAVSAHVVVDSATLAAGIGPVLDALQHCLHDHFGVAHGTFQVEPGEHAEHEAAAHP
ncbi:MAG: cobalt-zinc-cadmium efflux system protein [Frankiaceae bacterium]|nr:cobalt-zinc-cadmium efflux system protein [Frankiaceae bacterium]